MRKRGNRWQFIFIQLMVAITLVGAGWADASPPFDVSNATTAITSPLRDDGTVNYAARSDRGICLTAHVRPGGNYPDIAIGIPQ
jgi:hypothetical protein